MLSVITHTCRTDKAQRSELALAVPVIFAHALVYKADVDGFHESTIF
jgi:hypothetical protein